MRTFFSKSWYPKHGCWAININLLDWAVLLSVASYGGKSLTIKLLCLCLDIEWE